MRDSLSLSQTPSQRSVGVGVATYSKKTHTYYTTLTPSTAGASSDSIRVPILSGDSATAGLAVCPATHLLCQYLAYSIIASPPSQAVKRFSVMCIDPKNLAAAASAPPPTKSMGGRGGSRFPPLGKRVLELGCGAGLAGIVAALALSRKEREANAELCKAAAILDFDKIDLDDLSSDSSEEEGGGRMSDGGDRGMDDDSLASGGGGGHKKDDEDAIVVCTDGDPEAVELCRENVTRDLFLADDLDEGAADDDDANGDSGIDEEAAAAILAAAGQSGGVAIASAGQRNPSDHALAKTLDASRKRIIDSRHGSDESLSDSSSSSDGVFGGGVEGDVRVLARALRWGDHRAARDIMKEATAATSKVFATTDLDADFRASMVAASPRHKDERFDTVMAADIVLPSTSEEDLAGLFRSVEQCLKEEGAFLLSLASRDGHRTPLKVLEAASRAGFKIDCIPEEEFVPSGDVMPSTLDAKLLMMRRDEDAADFNSLLGSDSCRIFPGLKSQAEKLGR